MKKRLMMGFILIASMTNAQAAGASKNYTCVATTDSNIRMGYFPSKNLIILNIFENGRIVGTPTLAADRHLLKLSEDPVQQTAYLSVIGSPDIEDDIIFACSIERYVGN